MWHIYLHLHNESVQFQLRNFKQLYGRYQNHRKHICVDLLPYLKLQATYGRTTAEPHAPDFVGLRGDDLVDLMKAVSSPSL
jgi:hypothetical protein